MEDGALYWYDAQVVITKAPLVNLRGVQVDMALENSRRKIKMSSIPRKLAHTLSRDLSLPGHLRCGDPHVWMDEHGFAKVLEEQANQMNQELGSMQSRGP